MRLQWTLVSVILLSSLLFSLNVQAVESASLSAEEAKLLKELKEEEQKICYDSELLSCLELTESKCLKMIEEGNVQCVTPHASALVDPDSISYAEAMRISSELDSCGRTVQERYGIDTDKVNQCLAVASP